MVIFGHATDILYVKEVSVVKIVLRDKKFREYSPLSRISIISLLVFFFICGIAQYSSETTSDAPSEYSVNEPVALSSTPPPSLIRLNIKYDKSSLIYNNHVGNEWSTAVRINDNYLYRGENINLTVYENEKIVIYCIANENDKIMDYGSANILVDPSELRNGQNFYTCNVIVTENRGRYSGNTAKWEFTFTVTKN